MADLRLYHNPRCSKSRRALEILQERGADLEIIEYMTAAPDRAALEAIAKRLPDPPEDLVRKDRNFEHLGLDANSYKTLDRVIELLLEHPKLMQRPILVSSDRAQICRPPEKVLDFL